MRAILRAKSATVRQEGTAVVVIHNGRTVLDMPWEAALAMAGAIYEQAKKAEELAKAEAISFDQAILLRLGVPIGLSDRQDIREESQKLAAWDSRLRIAIPLGRAKGVSGVRSAEAVGTPSVSHAKRGAK